VHVNGRTLPDISWRRAGRQPAFLDPARRGRPQARPRGLTEERVAVGVIEMSPLIAYLMPPSRRQQLRHQLKCRGELRVESSAVTAARSARARLLVGRDRRRRHDIGRCM